MLAAPLILGNDLRQFILPDGSIDKDNKVLKIVSNKAAIAINQDKLGIQCRKVKTNGLCDVLVKPLVNNEIAICFLNKGPIEMEISCNMQDIVKESFAILPRSYKYEVYDIWDDKEFEIRDSLSSKVAPHSVKLYRIKADD